MLFWCGVPRFICGPESILGKKYPNILTVCQILNGWHICYSDGAMHGSFVVLSPYYERNIKISWPFARSLTVNIFVILKWWCTVHLLNVRRMVSVCPFGSGFGNVQIWNCYLWLMQSWPFYNVREVSKWALHVWMIYPKFQINSEWCIVP